MNMQRIKPAADADTLDRRSRGRRRALKALAATPLAVQAGAGAQVPHASPKVLRYAFEIAESGFDPAQITDLYSRVVTAHIFDGLYDYDYLARPFRITPNTADGMPDISSDFRDLDRSHQTRRSSFRMTRCSRASRASWLRRTTFTR